MIFFLITTGFLIWSFWFQIKEFKIARKELKTSQEELKISQEDLKVSQKDLRTSQEALEVDKLANLREHHHDDVRILAESKELGAIFQSIKLEKTRMKDGKVDLTIEERRIFSYYVMTFDLYERVFEFKEEQKEEPEINEVDFKESEWLVWLMYLEKMSHHWLFHYTFNEFKYIFDDRFIDEVRSKILEAKPDELFELYKTKYKEDWGEEIKSQKSVEIPLKE